MKRKRIHNDVAAPSGYDPLNLVEDFEPDRRRFMEERKIYEDDRDRRSRSPPNRRRDYDRGSGSRSPRNHMSSADGNSNKSDSRDQNKEIHTGMKNPFARFNDA